VNIFFLQTESYMKGELLAIVKKAPDGGYWAIYPEVPGANGQGETLKKPRKICVRPWL
jgi:hypothetical protein